MVRAGKALYVGASSMYAWEFLKMFHTQEKHGYAKFVTMQNHYNLVYREEEREMNPLCAAEGIGLIPGARWRAAFSRAIARRTRTRRRRRPHAHVRMPSRIRCTTGRATSLLSTA